MYKILSKYTEEELQTAIDILMDISEDVGSLNSVARTYAFMKSQGQREVHAVLTKLVGFMRRVRDIRQKHDIGTPSVVKEDLFKYPNIEYCKGKSNE